MDDIDFLVNNARIEINAGVLDIPPGDYELVIGANSEWPFFRVSVLRTPSQTIRKAKKKSSIYAPFTKICRFLIHSVLHCQARAEDDDAQSVH
jgi:NAD(P)-dependent dehydrogenase (short-subunit alcohol dehydrogenase family)